MRADVRVLGEPVKAFTDKCQGSGVDKLVKDQLNYFICSKTFNKIKWPPMICRAHRIDVP